MGRDRIVLLAVTVIVALAVMGFLIDPPGEVPFPP